VAGLLTMILIAKDIGSRELHSVFPLSEVSILSKLESGDIVFSGNGPDNQPLSIAIELKSLTDFIDSIRSGRLHGRQSRLMLSTYDVNYLAIYGIFKCDLETGDLIYLHGREWKPLINRWKKRNSTVGGFGPLLKPSEPGQPYKYSFLQSCIASAEAVGLRVKELPFSHLGIHAETTRAQLAYWIYCRYSWWSKRWEEHRSICQLDDSRRIIRTTSNLQTMGLTDAQLLTANVAKEFPGLRFERALAIAREFESPEAFLTASEDEIANVVTVSSRGRKVKIGKIIARNIKQAYRGKGKKA